MLDDEIEMESTGGVGGVAQISDEMEIDDVDSEDDNLKMCQVMKRVIKVDVMREMNLPLKLMLMKNL